MDFLSAPEKSICDQDYINDSDVQAVSKITSDFSTCIHANTFPQESTLKVFGIVFPI